MSDEQDELKREVKNFLYDFKHLMYYGSSSYYVKSHFKNIQALAKLEITERERDNIIWSLEWMDYSSGPHTDEYHPDTCFWIFGKEISSIEVYIKLKIYNDKNGNDKAICLSFHPSEHPLEYPFRT
ncbi:MAG TPA: hypothetical protein PLR53_09430 [Bacteroidales bacterium]|nr:hypothetical protein [Bacteroidales bacterium]